MEEKFKITGSYSVNGGAEKEFEIGYGNTNENEENNYELFRLLEHPWRLILEGGKYGVHSVKRFFGIVFLFAFVNTILFLFGVVKLFLGGLLMDKVPYLGLVLLLGLAATAYVAYRMYQFVILDTLRVIYKNLTGLFQKLSSIVVDKVADLWQGKKELSGTAVAATIDFNEIFQNQFDKLPNFLRKALLKVLNKIPLVGMLTALQDDLVQGKKEKVSAELYQRIDQFMVETVFGSNDTKWVWWFLPLNIVVMIIVIQYFM
ncbi:MAG: hypothetical protein AB8G15_12200 [Saprospiraceae bacterium]